MDLLSAHSIFAILLAGTALFLLGVYFTSENLENISSNVIRDFLIHFTKNPFFSFLTGVFITFILQSSGAITSMLVGLGSARVITLRQVMGVVMGTAVGSSLIVQILTFNVQQWGLILFSLSFFVYFFSDNQISKKISSVLMGIGLMYWGLEFVGMSAVFLKDAVFFAEFLDVLQQSPALSILVSIGLTVLVHSSAIVILFAVSLVSADVMSLHESMFWIYGANIGTTSTALMASFGTQLVGRQVAWAHVFYKVMSVIIFIGFTDYFISFFGSFQAGTNVALANIGFNLLSAIILFPFMNLGIVLIEKIVKPSRADKTVKLKFLNKGTINSPVVALAHSEREVLRMGDTVGDMVRNSVDLVMDDNEILEEEIHEKDNKVDFLYEAVYNFLANFSKEGRLTDRMTEILLFATDLESIADVVDKSILSLTRKKHTLKLKFSSEEQADIFKMHESVCRLLQYSLTYFQNPSDALRDEILDKKRKIKKMGTLAKEDHLARFVKKREHIIAESSIYMEILSDYIRMSSLACHHVYPKRQRYVEEDTEDKDE